MNNNKKKIKTLFEKSKNLFKKNQNFNKSAFPLDISNMFFCSYCTT